MMKNKILLMIFTIALLSVGCKKNDDDNMCHHKKQSQTTTTTTPPTGKTENVKPGSELNNSEEK